LIATSASLSSFTGSIDAEKSRVWVVIILPVLKGYAPYIDPRRRPFQHLAGPMETDCRAASRFYCALQ
jgi:hypothetical protein